MKPEIWVLRTEAKKEIAYLTSWSSGHVADFIFQGRVVRLNMNTLVSGQERFIAAYPATVNEITRLCNIPRPDYSAETVRIASEEL